MNIVLIALEGSVIVTVALLLLRFAVNRKGQLFTRSTIWWIGNVFAINMVVDLVILYFDMPAITGPYGGWQWLFWPAVLSGVLSLFLGGVANLGDLVQQMSQTAGNASRGKVVDMRPPRLRLTGMSGIATAGFIVIGLSFFVVIVANTLISIGTTWFDPNTNALAAIPHVQMMSAKAPLPQTDVQHIVLVTQAIAAFKGQQVLGQNGLNLGSKYHLVQEEYTLQSVNHHLYWIAPLVYNNIFANLGNYDTPGFVVVDAEDPNAPSQLRTNYHLRYVPDALFNQDLLRHVYLSGFTNGDLVDPTLEVDDNWQPYFTISLMQPSRGFTGEVVKEVLLVDPQSGHIAVYSLNTVPSWVDRVIPASVVSDYLGWWGLYHKASWFNPSGANQEKPASAPELVYNNVDQPVWLVPMTSSAATDNSSTGVILFDTHANAAKYYPLSGLGIGDNVTKTFSSNPLNIRNYDVSLVQLYQIYGAPTWVGIFTQSNSQGATFQSVGLLDARNLSGADVQMAPSIQQALSLYQQWEATNTHAGSIVSSQGTPQAFSGAVQRIAPTVSNGSTVYYIWVQGQSHILTAALSLSPLLPIVQSGDQINGTYLDTGTTIVTLTTFNDTSISLGTPTVSPTIIPTTTPAP